jgi:hypothetical protein
MTTLFCFLLWRHYSFDNIRHFSYICNPDIKFHDIKILTTHFFHGIIPPHLWYQYKIADANLALDVCFNQSVCLLGFFFLSSNAAQTYLS